MQDKIVDQEENNNKFLTKEEEYNFIKFAKLKTIDIFFDFDNYKLNSESLAKMSAILKYINTLEGDYKIFIIGHADRIGKAIYNNTLARRRANTVYNVLLKNGVPKDFISVTSLSSKSPKVITKRNEKNQLNRRVEIIIDTDYKTLDLNPQPIKL